MLNRLEDLMTDDVEVGLHEARHYAFSFPVNDHPLIDMTWGPGVMFGIHFAWQYPELAAEIEKVFVRDSELTGCTKGADYVAEVLRQTVFPRKALDENEQLEAWMKIAERKGEEEVIVVHGDFWPLPYEPEHGYQGA